MKGLGVSERALKHRSVVACFMILALAAAPFAAEANPRLALRRAQR